MKKFNVMILFLFLFTACAAPQQNIQATSTTTPNHPFTITPATATKRPKFAPTLDLTATEAVFPTEINLIDAPIAGTDALFVKMVLQSPQPVIVDFWAGWCTDCKPMAQTLEVIAKEYAGKVIVVKIDVDRDSDRAHWYGVSALPAVDFFVNGSLVFREVGSTSEAVVRRLISEKFGIRQGGN